MNCLDCTKLMVIEKSDEQVFFCKKTEQEVNFPEVRGGFCKDYKKVVEMRLIANLCGMCGGKLRLLKEDKQLFHFVCDNCRRTTLFPLNGRIPFR